MTSPTIAGVATCGCHMNAHGIEHCHLHNAAPTMLLMLRQIHTWLSDIAAQAVSPNEYQLWSDRTAAVIACAEREAGPYLDVLADQETDVTNLIHYVRMAGPSAEVPCVCANPLQPSRACPACAVRAILDRKGIRI